MREASLEGAVIGGIAVVLHGHIRTTKDIDIFVSSSLERLANLLTVSGFTFDPARKEFTREGVPIRIVLEEQGGSRPQALIEIDGVTTVSLADLIAMKLRSGLKHLLRAQDLADVIGLIRHRGLTPEFARHLDKDLRPEFRKLARAIQREGT